MTRTVQPSDIRDRAVTQQPTSVLVCDGDATAISRLTAVFPEPTYLLTHAPTAIDAIWMVRETESPPDVVLLDWKVGATAAQRLIDTLRADASDAVIVVLHPRLNPDDHTTALEAGADVVLAQSAPSGLLVAAVATVLQRQRALRAALHRVSGSVDDAGAADGSASPAPETTHTP